MGLHWNVPELNPIWRMTPEQLQDPKNTIGRAFEAYCKELKRVAAEAGIPNPSVYTHDEPGYDRTGQKVVAARIINDLAHQAGLPTSEAITPDAARQLGANLDLPIVDPQEFVLGPRQQMRELPHAWWYWHPLENPTYDRLNAGLVTWYMRVDGVAPYVLNALTPGGWDDWNSGSAPNRAIRYIYDGRNAPIPTLQFEAFREGVDDYKYLNMIERRLNALGGKALTAEQQQVVGEARQLVDKAPAPFVGGLSQWGRPGEVEERVTGADWAALRARMQDLVVKLDAVVHP